MQSATGMPIEPQRISGGNFEQKRVPIAQRNLPAAQFPESSNGLARGLEGLAKGAMALSDTFADIKNGEEEVQKAQLLDNTAVALTAAKQRVDQNGDHRDYMDRWNREVRPIRH